MVLTAIATSWQNRRRRAAGPRLWIPALCAFVLGAFAATERATASPLTFTNYTTGNGLATDIIWDVYATGNSIFTTHLYDPRISTSADGGASWSQSAPPPATSFKTSVTGVGSKVYLGTDGGVSVSNDLGATWNTRTTPGGSGASTVFEKAGKLYAGTGLGVSVSTNDGVSWTSSGTAQGLGSDAVYSLYADGSNVYAGTRNGLSVSTDGGATWNNTAFGIGDKIIWGVWGDGSTVYGATEDSGLKVSTNNGSTYSTITMAQGLASNDLRGVTVSGGSIYVAAIGGLSISSDGGVTWDNYTTANGLGSNIVLNTYVDGNKLYVSTIGGLSVATLSPTPSAVPEIDPAGLGSAIAVLCGGLGLIERRRRAFAAA